MKGRRKTILVFVLRLVVTVAILSTALPVIGAQRGKSEVSPATRSFANGTTSFRGAQFVHTATAANISSNWTYIDHPLTNGNPNAIVMVTQNWNPGGTSGTYNDHPIGVWYEGSAQKWAVFNQDRASMPEGAAFNVVIPPAGSDVFVHTATAANIVSNWTYIDHPRTNENPNAIVMVTQNWNPGGTSGTYNDHPIGVWYHGSAQKWAVFNQDLASMPDGAAFNVVIPPAGSDAFVHTATAATISSNWTYIDHPLTNENPNAIVMVTQNWNPGGGGGTYNNHPIGVWYHSSANRWAVFNQDRVNMPEGAAFNVVIATTVPAVFVHRATAASIVSNWTWFDHPLTNENPNAIVMVTQNWNPGGGGGTYNDHPIGVWYSSGQRKWAIFNQDIASMPDGAAFNVLIPAVDTSVFVHIARAANISSNWTDIDHPLTNGNPNAVVLVTQNWNPAGVGGTYNNHPIGVWYHSSAQKWAIFNQDQASMPEGAAFNVVVPPSGAHVFVHTATAANISSNWTYVDHPLTNGNPNAVLMVTQNWNPGGGSGTYNEHPIGVWYHGSAQKWAVFNQDLASMPDGAAFNVIVIEIEIGHKIYLPIVLR